MKKDGIVGLLSPLLVVFVVLACSREFSCEERGGMSMYELAMSAAEAVDILYTAETELDEYSHQVPFSLFCWDERYTGSDWSNAFSYHDGNGNDIYELDFDSKYRLQFYRRSRFGSSIFYDSFQKLQIIRNNDSKKTGVFIKTVVDFGEKKSKGFSGLVAYTRLDGKLVAVDRYDNDVIVKWVYLPGFSGQDANESRTIYVKGILDGIRFKRVASCIDTKGSNGGVDSTDWNLVIDSAAVCIADTSDATEYVDFDEDPWLDDWLPDDYWDNQSEPNPGGGGGGYSGHGGSNGNQEASESIKVGTKSATVRYGSEVSLENRSAFKQKLKELADIQLFKDIFMNLDFSKITVIVSSGKMGPWVSGMTHASYIKTDNKYSSVKIELNASGHILGYLEEFFHADQYLNSDMPFPFKKGDMEFEAKLLIARYYLSLSDNEKDEFPIQVRNIETNLQAIYDYYINRCEKTRNAALSAFVQLGYMNYPMSFEGATLDEHLVDIIQTFYKYYQDEK